MVPEMWYRDTHVYDLSVFHGRRLISKAQTRCRDVRTLPKFMDS